MSSSAERLPRQGFVRRAEGQHFVRATVVSPKGSVIVQPSSRGSQGADGHGVALDIEARLAFEREQGFEEGRQAGASDAIVAHAERRAAAMEQLARTLQAACVTAAEARRSIVDEVVSEAVDLAYGIAEALVGEVIYRRIGEGGSPAHVALLRATALVPEGPDLRVRVHPEAGLGEDDLEGLRAIAPVTVIADPSVELTGCIVEVGPARIDAQIAPALERVRAVLAELRTKGEIADGAQ